MQTIEKAARAIVELDRRAITRGEEPLNPGEIINKIPWAAYRLTRAELAAAFRMAAEMQHQEADALEREGEGGNS